MSKTQRSFIVLTFLEIQNVHDQFLLSFDYYTASDSLSGFVVFKREGTEALQG